MIKEVVGKVKPKTNVLPRRLIIDKVETYDKKTIATSFNNYFTNVGPKLASRNKDFKSYLKENEILLSEYDVSEKELEDAFCSLKINKSPGFDDISSNVVKNAYHIIKHPLRYIFNLSINHGEFPEKLKIARITPVFKSKFKSDDVTALNNYRPISVLPCFSKLLERIMYIDFIISYENIICFVISNLGFKPVTPQIMQ